MKKGKLIFNALFVLILSVFHSGSISAQMVGPDAYIKGTSVEIGISGAGGFEGVNTTVSPPLPGMHLRTNSFGVPYFGFVANPQLNGWAGSAFDGDFFTPGTPENGWGIEVGTGGTTYSNNCNAAQQIPGSITSWLHSFDCYTSDWEGDISNLHVKVNYFLQETDLFYTTTVSITNNSGVTIPDMYYYRNLDPDNNITVSGDYFTQNTIENQPAGSCGIAHVSATQTNPWNSYFGMAAIGANWRAVYGGFANRDASDLWTGAFPFTQTTGSSIFADEAVALAYRIQNLAPGATETFKFVVILSSSQAGNAINNLLYLSYPGSAGAPPPICTPYSDTVRICAGVPATIAVQGSIVNEFTWSWSPGTGLSTTTGPTTQASPMSTTTYTLTGTPGSACVSPVTMTFVVQTTPSVTLNPVSNIITCAGSSVPASAYSSTPSGATYTWTNSNPAIGLAASGSGNTPAFVATNSTGSPITSTISVTPTIPGGCTGPVSTYTITVNPPPVVNPPVNITVCAGAPVPASAFTSTPAGATYTWTNSDPAIGLVASGSGNTPAFTAANSTGAPITATINVIPTLGCTGPSVSYTITVNPLPIVTVNNQTICPSQTATLTATGGTTYLWNTGSSANPLSVTPLVTTSYTVTGTTGGCSSSAVATVTVGGSISVNVNSPAICAGQSAVLTATGGVTYSWSTGEVSNPITVTPAVTTSYTVTGTNGGCSGTAISTVTVNAVPVTTVDSPIICDGATATMTAAGAAGYTWSAGATSAGANTATASPTTTTTYTVTGANGVCVSTAVSTVTVNPIPAVTVDSPTICAGQTATMTAAGATSYTWSAGATSAGANTATASPAATTTYTVTGAASGCSNTAVSTVTVAPSLSITVNSPVICAGETANLTAGGAASYTWTAGTTVTGTNTADATPAATTTYTVTGTTGTCSGTAVSTVTVTPLPVVTVTSATICDGATANLTAGGASTYTWTAGATATGTNTADASPSTTTTYTVTGTDLGCSGTAVSTVTVNPIPTVTVSSPSICPGSTAQLTAGGATSYTWSPGATSTGPNTADATPASTATYTVTGTLLGCSSTAVATVTVNTVLSVDAGLPDSLCFGESANLSVSPNGAGYVYTWTPAASLSNASIFNPVASPAVTTTYSVTVTDPNGCTGNDDVTVYADPQITLALAGLPVSCNGGTDGQTIVIPAGGSGSFTYLWMTGGCTTAACNQAVGTYTVTVTDTWGCTATGTAVVTEPTVVTATSTQTEVTCFGTCNGTATATGLGGTPDAAGAYTYSWNTVPVQTTQTATGLCAGTYTCTVSDDNGCSATVSVTITEPALLDIDPMPALTICNSGSTPLAATVTGGTIAYTYSWSPAAGLSSTAVANPTATPAATTTYTLTVTDANLCSTTESVLVTVNPPLAVIAAGTASVCPGASTTISAIASNGAGSGYTYLWSPAAGLNDATLAAPTATPAATTTYTVTANDGCSPAVTATVTVSVLPTPVPVITSTVTSGCEPLCVSFTDASTISSGTITGWNWDFGDGSPDSISQNPSHCFNTPGSYTVTLTDTSAAGCIATSTIPYIITVNPIPVALFNAPASTSIFTPTVQYIDQSTVSTGSIVSWDWAFGDGFTTAAGDSSHLQNPSHLFTEVGTYCAELIVTTNAGCQDLTSLCIVIDPEFTFFIPNAFSPNDDGINEEFYGKGEHIKEYEMNIFDRWGNLIFHADDINEHWDGRANHGSEVAQEDVYVYVVKLTDNHDKIHKYIGTVTIVK
jgi:gliding motility-associated-like protein